jgi:CRP/FNR family cyclic AMP-dependent transcriptional regulator
LLILLDSIERAVAATLGLKHSYPWHFIHDLNIHLKVNFGLVISVRYRTYYYGAVEGLLGHVMKLARGPTIRKSRRKSAFDAQAFLDSAGVDKKIAAFRVREVIFCQGDLSNQVFYIQNGGVKLSVLNHLGREAVIAVLGRGEFFGEGCLLGLPFRMATATAVTRCTVLAIKKEEMIRELHAEQALADRFLSYLLSRSIRLEEDLVDQLFNSAEKRLARTLLLLARYGEQDQPQKLIAKVSQETLAEIIGTTRSRVNLFMNKFKRLGFIQYDGGLHINPSLLNVVLHD